jgi:hypothetical protein
MSIREERVSEAAYYQCKKNPKSPAWEDITDSRWALLYCRFINDKKEVRRHIKKSDDAKVYCQKVKDDPKVRKFII